MNIYYMYCQYSLKYTTHDVYKLYITYIAYYNSIISTHNNNQ